MGIGDVRFWTFNVADAAVSTAIVLLIGLALFPSLAARLRRRAGCLTARRSAGPRTLRVPDGPPDGSTGSSRMRPACPGATCRSSSPMAA